MYTKVFKEISKNDTKIAGGKGASLGEMTQAGIPVPAGFVVLTEGFEKFLESGGLQEKIDKILAQVKVDDSRLVEKASEEIRDIILRVNIPEEIEEEIVKSFEGLGAEFVAVRSSATAEDGSQTSWAGELESFLNTTKEMLLLNVKKCWASLFTARAIFYRFENKLDKTHVSVAVVVQKMVNSDVSGISFSVHPVTEDRNQLIIEAGLGLGEAIVSGSVTPDSYIVDKRDFSLIDVSVSEQEKKLIRKSEGGNEWVEIKQNEREIQKLSNEQVIELAKLIVKIEKHYNFPVDVEWALESGEIFITQSRPITTLH